MNLLIIENDADSLALFKEIVEDSGHSLLGTTTVDNGCALIRRGISIDAILLSTVLPQPFSVALAQLRTTLGNTAIPLIALVSSRETNEGSQALQQGCRAVIPKPLIEEDIVRVLNMVQTTKDEPHA